MSTENGYENEVDLEPGEHESDSKSLSLIVLLVKNLLFSEKMYVIDVFTGDYKDAGTDSNVFLTVYGKKRNLGEKKLASSKNNINKFERNQV